MKFIGKYPDTGRRSAIEVYCDLISTTLGERIKLYRKAESLTQSELGSLCNINPANLRKYESGRQTPKFETLERIAKALGTYTFVLYTPTEFAPEYMVKSGILTRWYDDIAINEAQQSFSNPDEILSELMEVCISDLNSQLTADDSFQDNAANLAKFIDRLSARDANDTDYSSTAQIETLFQDFNKLNPAGREKAFERIHELTEIPRYTLPTVKAMPASAAEKPTEAPQDHTVKRDTPPHD